MSIVLSVNQKPCRVLATSLEDAQVHAAARMVARFGRLLGPEEEREIHDVRAFGPTVQFRYQRELEPPRPAEGFSRIETIRFERTRDASFTNRAVIVWVDGVLGRRRTSGSHDVEVFAERGEILRPYQEDGWRVLRLSWQPQIAEEVLTVEQVDTGFVRMQERLIVKIDVLHCPHGGGPPVCWCRKPLPASASSSSRSTGSTRRAASTSEPVRRTRGSRDGSVFSTVTRPISSPPRTSRRADHDTAQSAKVSQMLCF